MWQKIKNSLKNRWDKISANQLINILKIEACLEVILVCISGMFAWNIVFIIGMILCVIMLLTAYLIDNFK